MGKLTTLLLLGTLLCVPCAAQPPDRTDQFLLAAAAPNRETGLDEESTRVPLIVRLPGERQAAEVTGGLVELVDLYPTLVELCNLPNPAHELEGTSFRPLLDDPDRPWKSAAFSESKREGFHGRTLRTQRYRYTEWAPLEATEAETERELYDLEEDPFEYENLALDPGRRTVVEELSRRLHAGWRAALPESI